MQGFLRHELVEPLKQFPCLRETLYNYYYIALLISIAYIFFIGDHVVNNICTQVHASCTRVSHRMIHESTTSKSCLLFIYYCKSTIIVTQGNRVRLVNINYIPTILT